MDIQNIAISLVKHYGYFGVFLVGFTQSIIQPVPVLPFMLISNKIGLNPWIIGAVGVLSNVLGAFVSYWLGYFAGDKIASRIISEKHYVKIEALFNRYGIFAILIGEPYKAICWMAGILKFPFYRFIIATFISRILHTIAYILIGHFFQKIF
ncbi:MAG: YqaA family protein [Hydrogenobaculum sp.]|nr:MAG: DedA family protein [Hydrogenobaculum sp.]HEK25893.1 DedA family protein [Hydrogenobaculum sp.]